MIIRFYLQDVREVRLWLVLPSALQLDPLMEPCGRKLSISEEFGRLDVVLDRSWEVQPVTWGALTWWDPLPCGKELISSLGNTDPLPFPSPALSVVGHPPTPRRKLLPQALHFRSTSASPSPIPRARGQGNLQYSFRYRSGSGSSPLAFPLPPSPDSQSFNSVFLHSESDPSPSYQHHVAKTPSLSPHYMCSSPLPQTEKKESLHRSLYPTPPDSMFHQNRRAREHYNTRSGNKFSFSKVPQFLSQIPNQTAGKVKSFSQSAVSFATPPSMANELRPCSIDLPPNDSGSNYSYY